MLSFCIYLVAGDSLKKVLRSGVLDKMDWAIMDLVKKSVAGAVDQARVGTSRPNHSVSIKLLDDCGERVMKSAGKKGDGGATSKPRGSSVRYFFSWGRRCFR